MPFLARKVASREKSSGKLDSGWRGEVNRLLENTHSGCEGAGAGGRGGGEDTFQSINTVRKR